MDVDVLMEGGLLSLLNGGVAYLAAFVYRLNGSSVLTVMVFAALFTAMAAHVLLLKAKGVTKKPVALDLMMVAFLASLVMLVILSARFSFLSALGISLLAGMISSVFRSLLA